MRLLLALLGVAFVAAGPSYPYHVDTRLNCPPEGYTAISNNYRLDRLPSGGKYAICQTSAQAAQTFDAATVFKWTVSSGVFKLRDSNLIVDDQIEIEFVYPARPDFEDVVIDKFDGSVIEWRGISVRGAPPADQLHAGYHAHWPAPFGNCGDIDTVLVAGVDQRQPSWNFDYCSSATSINKPTVFDGRTGMTFTDSKEIVVVQARFAGTDGPATFSGDSEPFADTDGYTGVVAIRSQLGFVNPSLYVRDDGMQVQDGSSVTVCDPFIKALDGDGFQVGANDDDHPSILAIAGVSNLFFPTDVNFLNDGIVYKLRHCPSPMKPTYNSHDWIKWWTSANA